MVTYADVNKGSTPQPLQGLKGGKAKKAAPLPGQVDYAGTNTVGNTATGAYYQDHPLPPQGYQHTLPNGSIHVGPELPPPLSESTPAAPKITKPAAPSNPLADFAKSPLGIALSLGQSGNDPAATNAYLNQFQGSLASARHDIATQLAGALQDIERNKGYSQAALGHLPSGINNAYSQADHEIARDIAFGDKQAQAYGMTGHTAASTGGSLSDYMAPEMAGMHAERGADLANVPLLGLGIQQAAAQAAAAANQGALGDYSSLDQLGAQLSGQAGAQAAQIAAAQEAAKQGYIQSLGLAGYNNANTLSQIKAQNTGAGTLPAGTSTAAATGPYANTGLSSAQVALAQQTPKYKRYSALMDTLEKGGYGSKLNLVQIAKNFKSLPPAVQQILAAENPGAAAALQAAK